MNATAGIDIDLITDLLDKQPHLPAPKRTLFDITGIRDREYSISQVIAFFLDPEEEHGFGPLFLDALIDLVAAKQPAHGIDTTATISVDTEWSTRKGRIDILVQGWSTTDETKWETAEWALIIENKIHAKDGNDLVDYWQAVDARKKVGLLLALDDRTAVVASQLPGHDFFALTHEQFMNRVKQSIGDYVLDARHEHLLLLKEHLTNLEGYYTMDQKNARSEEYLEFYRTRVNALDELDALYKHLGRYIITALNNVMQELGFEKDRESMEPTARHFHPDPTGWNGHGQLYKDSFRLWVDVPAILRKRDLAVNLEMHGKGTSHGEDLRNMFNADDTYTKDLGLKVGDNKPGGSYYHLLRIDHVPLEKQRPLEDAVRTALEAYLFNPSFNAVEACFDKWLELHPHGL